ncbi:MAG: hypothetical protein U9R53_00570 [Chloroflexota bacterium]|nr:hypothetical protein [Chloroflexota bacterium]
MNEILEKIKEIETQIEEGLWSYEIQEKKEEALEIYLCSEVQLKTLGVTVGESAYTEQQRVLSYCLMRQGNLLRQKGKSEEAVALGEREMVAAIASGDEVMLARSLMSNGSNYIVTGDVGKGLDLIEESRKLFEGGKSHDHKQGLGWYWILQADLATAGLIQRKPSEIIEITDQILEILEPIENWPGVARAYAARAKAHENMGKEEKAEEDRKKQQYYERKVEAEGESAG